MPKYVAAIDQITTSTGLMIFDHGGTVAAVDQKGTSVDLPATQPGGV
jgi:glycerol kinase